MKDKSSQKTWKAEEIRSAFPEVSTLRELIEEASEEARQRGAIVCAVCVNGMALSENDENQFAHNSVSKIFEFSIKTQDLETLLAESRGGCGEFLGQLMVSIDKAATIFRTQDIMSAHKFYRVCIEGTQLFVEMMTHYKIAYKNAKGISPFHSSSLELCLVECLSQILEAYRQKNYSLVADLLEYELGAKLGLWQNELGLPVVENLEQEPKQDINVHDHSKTELIPSP